nr:Ig-like domain-containing protein [Deltaproteobacteria bacterium]
LLSRAKPIEAAPADKQAFALRAKSQPPPRTGQTITSPFPPPPSTLLPPAKVAAELTVLRWTPEGKVPLAPELSITFSQPMVAITSQDAAATVTPVKLLPAVKGSWRWIGTRTLVFNPEARFPQATTYAVEIPAGTKSATGGILKAAKTFTFETPPPQVVATLPLENSPEPQRLDTPVFVLFDQKIDPAAVLRQIKVTAAGTPAAIRLLDAAELARPELARVVENAKSQEQEGRWLAFRAVQPLPADTKIAIEIAVGTPSAEGPNKTTVAKQFGFTTYPPFAVKEMYCAYQTRQCNPGSTTMTFELNNPADAKAFTNAQVTITPAIPNSDITVRGRYLEIHGETTPNATYKVVLAKALRDEFGQTLATDVQTEFTTGDAIPTFFGPSGNVVLDPAAKQPALEVFSQNHAELDVKLYQVTPADYAAYRFYVDNQWNEDKPPKLPGKKVFDAVIKTALVANELVATAIDLKPALGPSGFGHVIASVEPVRHKTREHQRLISWVQATRLAIDAHADATTLTAFATELATGKPAAGVQVELRPWGITATTDATGLATLPLAFGGRGEQVLLARRGEDLAMLLEDQRIDWHKRTEAATLAWFVTDDRKMYKPSEVVSLKGFLRSIQPGTRGDVGASGVTSVRFTVTDSQDNQIHVGTAAVNANGGFDAKFTLPKTPNLGAATIEFAAGRGEDDTYTHEFEIQEFRRPEFEVAAKASQGPFILGESGDVTVDAKYYAGGPLAGAAASWKVEAHAGSFAPPNRSDYTFGTWVPWWGGYTSTRSRRYARLAASRSPAAATWTHKATTDATGAH